MTTRQRAYQLRQVKAGRCMTCGKPRATATYCREHADAHNRRRREKVNARWRKG